MSMLEPAHAATTLADIDPESTPGISDQEHADKDRERTASELADLQERLFASSRAGDPRRVLLVLQGMDTSGKGGILRHVIGVFDPQGVQITSFKAPTPEEREHDFLWRIRRALPQPGIIGVFDRSHYEDVLIHRVRALSPAEVVEARYGIITEFERELTADGTLVRKVMLHISNGEQRKRLAQRLERPDKLWKFNPGDIDERRLWPAYQEAYEIAIRRTSTAACPWFVVPADHKWYARWAVHQILLDALREMAPTWPQPDFDVDIERARLAAS